MIKRDNVRVCVPRYMQIGKGSLSQLPEILNIIGSVKSPLIVTDKQMVKFGYVKKLQEILLKAGLKSSVFDDTIPDPTDTVVLNGIDVLKKNSLDDFVKFLDEFFETTTALYPCFSGVFISATKLAATEIIVTGTEVPSS